MKKAITIVGGGLAGLTLGIGLRQREIPVVIWEAGTYPRHRVCGEFISGRGQKVLEQLGLREKLFNAGLRLAETASFHFEHFNSPEKKLPQAGWCLSRDKMDLLLANEFRRIGGDLREGQRWTSKDASEGVVRASGRRIRQVVQGWRWLGVKVHARSVCLKADLELHFIPAGYVGLCRLRNDWVNVCALLRHPTALHDFTHHWVDWLKGSTGSALCERMTAAEFDRSSFCAVAGFSLEPQKAAEFAECSIGDALTMIPPLTGNGMSMAFEAAEMATQPLAGFSEGRLTWHETRDRVSRLCDERFARRLRNAKWLQRLLFCKMTRQPVLRLGASFPGALAKLFAGTR